MYFITLERKNEQIRIDIENTFTLFDLVKNFYKHHTLDDNEYLCIFNDSDLIVKVSGHFIRHTDSSWVIRALETYHSNCDRFCPSDCVAQLLESA